jgi:hypothetical protein
MSDDDDTIYVDVAARLDEGSADGLWQFFANGLRRNMFGCKGFRH